MRRMNALRLLATAAAIGGLLTTAACDGENLFSVPPGNVGNQGTDDEAPVVVVRTEGAFILVVGIVIYRLC